MAFKKCNHFLALGVFLFGLQGCHHSSLEKVMKKRYTLFSDDQALVSYTDPKTHLMGYKDQQGKIIISPRFDYAEDFESALAAVVSERGKFGLIDREGEAVVPLEFDGFKYRQKDNMLLLFKGQKKYQVIEMGYTDSEVPASTLVALPLFTFVAFHRPTAQFLNDHTAKETPPQDRAWRIPTDTYHQESEEKRATYKLREVMEEEDFLK